MINSLKQKELESQATVERKKVFQGRVFTVFNERLEFASAPPLVWDIVVHSGAVAILPIEENGDVILIQQWRRPVKEILYEIPAGVLEAGENPLDAAQRELQEEIGKKAGKLVPFGGIYSAPGFCNEYIHLFVGKQLIESRLPGDDHEAIDLARMPLKKALSLIDSGEILDAKTISCLLRYAQKERV